MSMIFDHDWWYGDGLARQIDDSRRRAAINRFPDIDPEKAGPKSEFAKYQAALEARIIIYLRDNAIYEVKSLSNVGRTSYLSFECLPADEVYRVGAFVVAIPFDEIARVEVFAVHPTQKPEESPYIKGFGGAGPRPGPPDRKSPAPEGP